MSKRIIIFLSILLLLANPVNAKKKGSKNTESLGIQEVQAATLDGETTKSKKKVVKKATKKKAKKSKKSKKNG